MSLEYIDWEIDGVTVMNLTGRITLGAGTKTLRKVVQDMVAEGKKRLVLNMAEVVYIDSSGLGELVAAYTSVDRQGGKLKLLNLPMRAQELLTLTRLHTVFEIFDDETAAVRSFGPPTSSGVPAPSGS